MQNNRLFIALGAMAALAIVAVLVTRKPAGDAVERPSSAWAAINRDQVTRIVVQRPGQDAPAVTLEKRENNWVMTAPANGPADQQAVTDALDQITQMRVESVAARESSSYANLEVDREHAIHLQVFRGTTQALNVWVGRNVDGGTAVRVEGRPEVFRVDRSIRNTLNKEVREWRDRSIVNITRDHIRSVEWRNGEVTFTFNRNGDSWSQPAGAAAIERLDTARVNQTVENLRELRATDFAASGASTGLSDSSPSITFNVDNGPSVTLRLGSNTGESDVYVQRVGSDIVYAVGRSHRDEIAVDTARFQAPPPQDGGTDAASDAAAPAAPAAAGGGGQQIPPEMMERIRQQLQQRGMNLPTGASH